ncbi:MAG: hypothetical protein GW938_15580 [Leptospira sp.]|nr:hypothetical protein [Leptospira sp.]
MALATVTQLRSFLQNKVIQVSDDTLNLYLDLAVEAVVSQGVAVDHPKFYQLQMYITANDLEIAGIIERDVSSESADGISRSYFGNGRDAENSTAYYKLFQRTKFGILGFAGRSGV